MEEEKKKRASKSPFVQYHRNNDSSQEPSMDAKISGQKNHEKQEICIVSQNLPLRYLLRRKEKRVSLWWKNPKGTVLTTGPQSTAPVTTHNSTSNDTHWRHTLIWYDVLDKAIGVAFMKKKNIISTYSRNHQRIPNWGTFCKITDQDSFKCQGHERQRKMEDLSQREDN